LWYVFLLQTGGQKMEKGLEAIRQRISVRSYAERPVEPELRKQLEELCLNQKDAGPFGAAVRFKLLDLEPLNSSDLRKMGTYGIIKGARHYILGAVRNKEGSMADLGYCLEKIILEATALGLGTCWMGGTFKRSAFAAQMELAEDELLPAITPVGYPAVEKSTTERVMRFGAGSNRRKPWSELFFKSDGITALSESECGTFREAYEAVRMGPSASNKQPWRLVLDQQGATHLYLKENKIYNRMMGKVRLQLIDMGIAMCHFEVAARELSLPGAWHPGSDGPRIAGLQHIACWK
jgi:nitroreductase